MDWTGILQKVYFLPGLADHAILYTHVKDGLVLFVKMTRVKAIKNVYCTFMIGLSRIGKSLFPLGLMKMLFIIAFAFDKILCCNVNWSGKYIFCSLGTTCFTKAIPMHPQNIRGRAWISGGTINLPIVVYLLLKF